jgi:bacterial/archaeal transporter family protein
MTVMHGLQMRRRYRISNIKGDNMNAWLPYTLFTILVWGLWGLFSKLAVGSAQPRHVLIFQAVGMLAFAIVALCVMGFSIPWSGRAFTFSFLAGITAFAGYFTFFMALERGKAVVVVPLSTLGPVFTAVLSTFLLRERPTLHQLIGVVLAISACIVVAL